MYLRPLHADLGAEVLDFDLQQGGKAEEVTALVQAYERYHLLLFRSGGRISPQRQVEIASWFGPPPPVSNSDAGDFVSVLDNDEAAGSMKLPFHSDFTYTDVPIKAICLHAISLPDEPSTTQFISGVAAWQKLTPALQDQLKGLTLRHLYVSNMPEYGWPDFQALHPVCLSHPRTGKPVLFVTEHHADRIMELEAEQSSLLIGELCAHLYQPSAIYQHAWQIDDLMIWDNLAIQHARPERSEPAGGKRALQRVALSEVGLSELVERARAKKTV